MNEEERCLKSQVSSLKFKSRSSLKSQVDPNSKAMWSDRSFEVGKS
jgi:hypothetical protein